MPATPRRFLLAAVLLAGWLVPGLPMQAVIVRGHVTSAAGVPLAGARVQLIRLTGGARNAADTISGADGAFEIRSSLSGRFLLLSSASINTQQFKPQIGQPFYAGRTDLLGFDIALDTAAITPQASAEQTGVELPLEQLATRTAQVAADRLLTEARPLLELSAVPGAFVVQLGQVGLPATLFLRGAPVDKLLLDGVAIEGLGGGFDLGRLTSTGLSAVTSQPALELTPGPNPFDGLDAEAGVLSLHTALASTLHPTLVYAGDAGNFSAVRNEATFTLSHSRVDALLAFSRLNTDNDLPAGAVHLITYAANVGYFISGGMSLRATLRDDVSATPLTSPFAFYLVQPVGKEAAQSLYSAFFFDTHTSFGWHNQLRYGLAREREETLNFFTPATGLAVTIRGANEDSASGVASFIQRPSREDLVSDRDQFAYETDYPFARFLTGSLTARYESERGADLLAVGSERVERVHLFAAASLAGEVRHRLFVQALGSVDHSSLLGLVGTPRLGLTYVPVRPGTGRGFGRLRGTNLHFSAATGAREPTLAEQFALPAAAVFARSRAVDAGVDQNLYGGKLTARATYFHQQFSHQAELLGEAPLRLSNALAYRTQGLETELRYQPLPRLRVHGGYTYLASLVERSAAVPSFNPQFGATPIGGLTALAGARPFERPTNSGFAAVEFTGPSLTASVRAVFAGRSDGSTGLVANPSLLLPNRDLSPGYTAMDASLTYALTRHLTVYTQLTNLLNNREMAPLGYLATPFLVRTGLRIRLGRE